MLLLPHPFYVVPLDGSDGVRPTEIPNLAPPFLGVAYVTPFCAAKWLRAGDPVWHPVVMLDEDHEILAGYGVVEMAAAGAPDDPHAPTPAAVVRLGAPQRAAASGLVVCMRDTYHLAPSPDVSGLVLDFHTGRVLGGATAIYDLRRPQVMVVLVTDPTTDARWN